MNTAKQFLLFITFYLFTNVVYGQSQKSFDKLVAATNTYITQYSTLYPYEEYYEIKQFGLSKNEIQQLIAESNDDDALTTNKDSIATFHIIGFFQEKIFDNIQQLIVHNNFPTNNIQERLPLNDDLSIIISKDNKLLNFSLDEKTGGTYRSRISRIYFYDNTTNTFIDVSEHTAFHNDGYTAIDTLKTEEGTKYLLSGNVRGCSYCFETSVQLLNNELIEEFSYIVNNRDLDDGVFYDYPTRTIHVDYHINDLTPYCYCDEASDKDRHEYDSFADHENSINCTCTFVFDGKNFKLVKEGWEKIKRR